MYQPLLLLWDSRACSSWHAVSPLPTAPAFVSETRVKDRAWLDPATSSCWKGLRDASSTRIGTGLPDLRRSDVQLQPAREREKPTSGSTESGLTVPGRLPLSLSLSLSRSLARSCWTGSWSFSEPTPKRRTSPAYACRIWKKQTTSSSPPPSWLNVFWIKGDSPARN